ncbi:MAG: sce7725 family protein [Rhodococcus sp. (in: high G+C Gram-positive bacteria)]|uniref:sce7725 family protein n=1 Tax=Rhodococcus sp. TaxID=1831 RepID=UPI002AD5FA4D|nr:sce7725 family protein [Rhodococcus sp. (in: high G+C Gram-positive bacteria)]
MAERWCSIVYYPYLRGKQFELLALKEMAERSDLGSLVCPVVEPVRPPESGGLGRAFAEFHRQGIPSIIIVNPSVGPLSGSMDGTSDIIKFLEDSENGIGTVGAGVIVDSDTNIEEILSFIRARRGPNLLISLFHKNYNDRIPELVKSEKLSSISGNFAESRDIVRLYDRVLLEDPTKNREWRKIPFIRWKDHFPRMDKNVQYVGRSEQLFSADNVYMNDDGYAGISDFQTVGNYFQEGGGLPWAVAIHLTYQKDDDGPVYISHFTSHSNDDASDTAGKFAEALHDLVEFVDLNKLVNPAIEAFRTHNANGTYPGLGSLKKISIQNHVYVMQSAMDLK